MNYNKAFPENEILAKYIKCFYVIEVDLVNDSIPGVGEVTDTVYHPCGAPELLYNVSNGSIIFHGRNFRTEFPCGSSIIFGQMTRFVKIVYPSRIKFFGVRFKPYGLYPFLGKYPIKNLTDRIIASDVVFGETIREASRECGTESSVDDFARVMSKYLSRAFDPQKHLNDELVRIIDECDSPECVSTNIESLTGRLGFSRQYFFSIFKKITGVCPKTFQKIARITIFRKTINDGYSGDILSLILSLGYFDQAHFCNEFKSVIGITSKLYYKNLKRIVFE